MLKGVLDNLDFRHHAKQFANIAISRGLVIFIQLFYIKIYSNILTKPELGLYSFWMAVSYVWTALLFVPLDQFQQTNFLRMRDKGISPSSFLPVNLLALGTAFAGCLIAVAAGTLWTGGFRYEFAICFLLAIMTYVASSLRNLVNNLGHKTVAAMSMVVEALGKLLLLYGFILLAILHPVDVVFTAGLAMALVVLCLLPFVRKYAVFSGAKREYPAIGTTILFCAPLAGQAVLNWAQLRGVSFLAPLGHAETVGIYFTVAGIGQAGMSAVSAILGQMFIPELLRTNGSFLRKYLAIGIAATLAIMLVVLVFGEFLTRLLTNPQFVPFAMVAEFGVLVEAGNMLFGGIMVYFQLHGETLVSLKAGVIAIAICAAVLAIVMALRWLTPYTIGSALVLSQAGTVLYLFFKCTQLERSKARAPTT